MSDHFLREHTMPYAHITGWGKCIPPASISNDEISKIVDTTDEWITSRTGIKSRRVSHVSTAELATVALPIHLQVYLQLKPVVTVQIVIFYISKTLVVT